MKNHFRAVLVASVAALALAACDRAEDMPGVNNSAGGSGGQSGDGGYEQPAPADQ